MSSPRKRGPGRPRTRPVQEQRSRVLTAARAVFAERGRSGATIEQIAREAGVRRQTVYELFEDRGTLFDQVVADAEELAYATIAERGAADAELDLHTWARRNYAAMFTLASDHPDVLAVLQQAERAGTGALTRLRGRLAEVYTEASRRRWAEHGVEPGRANTALVAMWFAMAETLVAMRWPAGAGSTADPAGETDGRATAETSAGDADAPDPEALIDLLTEFTVGGVLRLQRHTPDVIDRLR